MAVESVRNAVRHSRATAIRIEVSFAGDTLTARVTYNGRGFDMSKAARPDSFGLRGMQERANAAGAALNRDSGPQGTTICLTDPA